MFASNITLDGNSKFKSWYRCAVFTDIFFSVSFPVLIQYCKIGYLCFHVLSSLLFIVILKFRVLITH
jgi:hypothetical protein